MANIKDLLASMIGKINGKVTAPATAQVGQTVVVKTVDENGKPTEWECADLLETDVIIPSSSEGSTKRFKLTVDDSGTITATEVT